MKHTIEHNNLVLYIYPQGHQFPISVTLYSVSEKQFVKNKKLQKPGNKPSLGFVVPLMHICFPDSSWQVDKNKADGMWPQWVEQRQSSVLSKHANPD